MRKNTIKSLLLAFGMTLTLSMSACQTSSDAAKDDRLASSSEEVAADPAKEASVAETGEKAAGEDDTATDEVTYPVTITDHLGRSVTIESQPESLVSGYYITSSLLISLGLDDQMVGVEAKADTRNIYSLSAPEILTLPNVGTAKEFDLEGCAALDPDLVILPAKLKDTIPALEELGMTVLAVNPENQNLLFETIDMIDTAANVVSDGEALKNYITDSLTQLDTSLTDSELPSVYLAGNSSILETAGPAMYQNTLIENADAANVASELTDTYWASVSYEQILSWNPEYIILAADAEYTIDSVLADPGLAGCTAITEKNVYQLPNTIESLDSPVPGSFLGSFYLASILHPDLVTPEDYQAQVKAFYETFYSFTPGENEK
ncbi:MAG: ABC transporter substrate-binding protein [Clostridia bacterium]|nr:ABC transporter substrate-binding protein [Clostridia bacterium]NCC44181.1 ABC transporter substrate-binding protein [Clostridia bacterium]